MTAVDPFRYEGFELDPGRGLLTCRYSHGHRSFQENITFDTIDGWSSSAVTQAARLIFLLTGISYYKTAAPLVIDLCETPLTNDERDFIRTYYLEGLGEFSYLNGLDLSELEITGGKELDLIAAVEKVQSPRVLIPFGGGIDSIVTVEMMRSHTDAAVFILSPPRDRFTAIEAAAATTELPIVRAHRTIDPQLLHSKELGFLNGHVPVTGILSGIAVMAAVLDSRSAVVMSNEWSASVATLESGGKAINHQYSKSAGFEHGFREVVDHALGGRTAYFSALRAFTELWVARKFASLERYHRSFHSCNRAFVIEPKRPLDEWCGRCDKCCFINLILAPFLPVSTFQAIFNGSEPLGDLSLTDRFRGLLGTSTVAKPFECVGDATECQAAVLLSRQRPDRAGTAMLSTLAGELPPMDPAAIARLFRPVGQHAIPREYLPHELKF